MFVQRYALCVWKNDSVMAGLINYFFAGNSKLASGLWRRKFCNRCPLILNMTRS